jgi:Flp pilus assembly pilin Flp
MRRFIPKAQFRRFLTAQDGTTAIEYSIIASGIACALIAAIVSLGDQVVVVWTPLMNLLH